MILFQQSKIKKGLLGFVRHESVKLEKLTLFMGELFNSGSIKFCVQSAVD